MVVRPAWRRQSWTPIGLVKSRRLTTTTPRHADFTHAVIGGGVIGLAIARELAAAAAAASSSSSSPSGSSTVLLERHPAVGTETSSRNSEVIHAGLYYGAGSLKTRLCVRGKHLLCELCAARAIPHRRTGKWIVAQTAEQRAALQRIHDFCARADADADGGPVPVRWVGAAEAARREPAVRARAGVLESPTTGIVDSHALMMCLLGLFEDQPGSVLALGSTVEAVRPVEGSGGMPGSRGWELQVRDTASGESSTVTAETIVNAAGLGAVAVHNMIVPAERRLTAHYAKGNYFSYAASSPAVSTLVYPAPQPGLGGLGTHLTLDLAGRMRFGPDVEWVESADDLAVGATRLPQAVAEIKQYLPGLDETALAPDYAGIRPKLSRMSAASGKGFQDFIVRVEDGYAGWVNLLGIESPGLTSSLAIAEMVRDLLYR